MALSASSSDGGDASSSSYGAETSIRLRASTPTSLQHEVVQVFAFDVRRCDHDRAALRPPGLCDSSSCCPACWIVVPRDPQSLDAIEHGNGGKPRRANHAPHRKLRTEGPQAERALDPFTYPKILGGGTELDCTASDGPES